MPKKQWVKQKEWIGNPSLDYECWSKTFDKYEVYVFGKKDLHKEPYQTSDFHYTIKNEFSGMLEPNSTAKEVMDYLDCKYETGQLLSGSILKTK